MTTTWSRTQSTSAAFLQSAGAKLLIVAINASTGILSARALQPEGRGVLAAIILWYIFLANAFTLGIPSALTYQVRRHPERSSDLVGAALLLSVAISLIAVVIGYVGIPYWIPQYPKDVIFFARLFLLYTPVASLFIVARAAFESRGDFAQSNLSVVGPPAITLLLLAGLWNFHHLTPVNAAFAYVPSGVPSFLWMAARLYRTFHPRIANLGSACRLLLTYGMRSYGIDLCGTMSIYVDQALVVRMLEPKLMGTYVVALSLSRMLNAFHGAVAMVLFPRAVSKSPEVVLDMTARAVRMSTFLSSICGIGIVLLGPQLLDTLYGPKYRAAGTILRILVLEVVVSGATQVMSQAFMALGRPGVITALQAFGLLLTIPLMFVLIPRMGITGAALALLVSTSARFAFVFGSFSRFLDLPRPDLVLRWTDLKFMRGILASVLGTLQAHGGAGVV